MSAARLEGHSAHVLCTPPLPAYAATVTRTLINWLCFYSALPPVRRTRNGLAANVAAEAAAFPAWDASAAAEPAILSA